jgi:pyruvate dehydrogenase E2 component (dihydrolipoamide acetyltransferase)
MSYDFAFPDVGEGITEGELLSWKVAEGELIVEDQTLAEVETDKAVVEIPSPKAGRILKLHAAEGETIKVGQVLVTIDELAVGASGTAPVPAPPPTVPVIEVTAPKAPAPPVSTFEPEEEHYTGSVVGQLEEAPEEPSVPAPGPPPTVAARRPATPPSTPPARPTQPTPPGEGEALALPSVRALARELGVDLSRIRGTGPQGRILRQDVEEVAEAAAYGRDLAAPRSLPAEPGPVQAPASLAAALGGDLTKDEYGPVERVVFRGVRRTMARRMGESLSKQAQVTTTEDADVSVLRRIREKERSLTAERGIRLTYLAFVVKAAAAALRRFPRLNAVLTPGCDEVVLKHYYNIGLAVDTPAGLVVPNIKGVDGKSIFAIAEEIVDLVERAQQRRLDLAELHGGTFTISNYGAIGGLYATPVTNYPEVAVLGMGRVRDVPVVRKGEVVVRQMLPMSLTFDHQLIDGAEATRFLNLVIGYVEDPDLLLLEGA